VAACTFFAYDPLGQSVRASARTTRPTAYSSQSVNTTDTNVDPGKPAISGLMYHYTSLDAFLSIVEHKVLRATSVNYLNDASEGALGQSLIYTRAMQELQGASGVDREFLAVLINRVQNQVMWSMAGAVYVLCFTEKSDDLNQWRGYTPHGRGVCLGIDLSVLVSRMQQMEAGWTIQDCKYEQAAQVALVNAMLSRMRDSALREHAQDKRAEHFAQVIYSNMGALLQVTAQMKNQAFKDEREVRLISPLIDYRDPRVKFRAGQTTVIPYIEFPLLQSAEDVLPSIDVCVGPGPTQSLAHAAAAQVTLRHNISRAVSYRRSIIPYREL
jgi:hypothetical protein